MSTVKKFAGQTAVYGVSTIAGRVLNFFLTPVYVRAYTTKTYGILGNLYSYVSLLNALLAFGMETTFFRYVNKKPDDKEAVYNNAFGAIILLTVFFLLLTFPFIGGITRWVRLQEAGTLAEYEQYIRYFIGVLVVDAWCVIPFALIRANGQPGRYGKIKLLNIVIFVALNLIFIYVIPFLVRHQVGTPAMWSWYRKGWVGYVFLSNLVASMFTMILLLPELLKLKPRFNSALMLEMLAYSWPVLIANLSFLVNENIDKILLGKLLPVQKRASDVGVYVACSKISIFLSIFINAFRLGAEPFFFSHSANKNAGQTYAKIMQYFVMAVCFVFVFLVTNIGWLKYFIRGKDAEQIALFWSGLDVVPILLFGYVSLGVYMNLSIWYKLSDQTRYGLYISGIGALVTIVLNVIFIPRYSYMAAAWVSLTAYATMMILSYVIGQKNYPIPYDLKKNLLYIVSSAVVAFLSFVVFHRNILIGNALLAIYVAAIAYIEKDELRKLWKMI